MIRSLAIDDEPLALAQITSYIDRTPFLQLAAACTSALEAAAIVAAGDVDLLFVDVNMPDVNGLDFVRSLQRKPMVVFTTAYAEYAIDGFRVEALDYLLKPIGYPDFLCSAEKALRRHKLLTALPSPPPAAQPDILFVKSGYKTLQIDIPSITHIESRSEYLRIYALGSPAVMTLGSLKSIEEKLPPGRFMRIHRSWIVNLQKITSIDRSHIILQGNIRIPIGEQYRPAFRTYLSGRLL
jgi:two-component system LytT family response regulator